MKTIKFHKGECGVEFLLNILTQEETDYSQRSTFNTDYFEVVFFKNGSGNLLLNEQKIKISENCVVFISAFQKRTWKLESENLEYTTLIFQEDFLNEFFSDKLFTCKLLYFYQAENILPLIINDNDMEKYLGFLKEIKQELVKTEADSGHLIRSLTYYILQSLNREYAVQYRLPVQKSNSNYAFQYKQLLEKFIREKQRIHDYTEILKISRISLNKAVKEQFDVTATQLLKQRLIFEIKDLLIHSDKTVFEIAYELNFSDPSHLMRFFKTQTGQTTSQFLADYQNGIN